MSRGVRFADDPPLSDEERTPVRTKPHLSPLDTSTPVTPTGPQAPTPPLSPISSNTDTTPTGPPAPTSPLTPTSPTTPATPGGRKRNRKSRSRAKKTQPVDPAKKRIERLGFKRYWVDQRENWTPIDESEETTGSGSIHPPPPAPGAFQMNERTYAEHVKKVRKRASGARRDGSGTYEDPEIVWLEKAPAKPAGRYEAILKICQDACRMMQQKRLWIRSLDHATTRTFTHTATHNGDGKRRRSAYPHITVYIGASFEYEYEGHLYIEYVLHPNGAPTRVPSRLGRPGVRRDDPKWLEQVVELWDRKFIRDRASNAGLLDT
ncbi:hypothetical protein BJY00DRAFT_318421 [Aspergillus carlsbadensis]|nr:hypothetical protein BJY00DRAFT_318421 [Aspergillus carlsbadensis]